MSRMRKKKVDLSQFKIEVSYTQDSLESEKQRFKMLAKLIFPHLSSAIDQGLESFSEKSDKGKRP